MPKVVKYLQLQLSDKWDRCGWFLRVARSVSIPISGSLFDRHSSNQIEE